MTKNRCGARIKWSNFKYMDRITSALKAEPKFYFCCIGKFTFLRFSLNVYRLQKLGNGAVVQIILVVATDSFLIM
jgi:hypothetical protein